LDATRNFSIYCIVGQYEGQQLPVGQQPIVIGRNPGFANLVIASDDISSTHVKVWLNESDNGIWIEDLNSTNGTFYRRATSDDSSSWIQLSGSNLLSPGDRFRLSQGKAVFEVRKS